MVSAIINHQTYAISIADSPGMGKTLVFSSLARHIQCQKPHFIVLFIVLQEFVQQLTLVDSSSSALEAIAKYSSSSKIADLVLLEMMKSETRKTFLFLDGYDEVVFHQFDVVDSFLKHLQDLKNVTVIVASRPHLQARLEILFSQVSYAILPFNESNQIDFLTRYWIHQNGAMEGKILEAFARQCLSAFTAKLTDSEKEIAGIPLQCTMLAEVYAEDAKRASTLESLRPDLVKSISFFQMYKELIRLKFSKIKAQDLKEVYQNAHIYDAITLLFPDWIPTFKPYLTEREKVDENVLYSIGLVEKSPNASEPRFIHRTFAEYLLAEFIVLNLSKHRACLDLLLGEILGTMGTNDVDSAYAKGFYFQELQYPVILYFMEMHLKEYLHLHSLDELLVADCSKSTEFDSRDVCEAIGACCSNDLETIFDYVKMGLNHCSIGEELKDVYFMDLPHIVVERTGNVSLLRKVIELTDLEFGADLSYHTIEGMNIEWHYYSTDVGSDDDFQWAKFQWPNYTPLHLAVMLGKYNFVAYLVKEYGDEVRELKYLLHPCVYQSASNSLSVIEDKMLIIGMLLKINRNWLHEVDHNGSTPLLQLRPHLGLLKFLVELGADINVHSCKIGTILHLLDDKNCYMDLVRWAFSKGFKIINHPNYDGKTPLMHAIRVLENNCDEELLSMFHKASADMNVHDINGDSVLFYALTHSGDANFISGVLECGASVHHRNFMKQNAVHKATQGSGSIEDKLTIIDMLVRINPNSLHETDLTHCTPLLLRNVPLRLLQRLVEHGSDINAYSSLRGTVLHQALQKSNYEELVQWALSNGFKEVNHTDKSGRTPLMHAIKAFGALDDDVLKLFHQNGTNFNAHDTRGNSVLFYALQYSESVHFIKKLLEYGVNLNHRNFIRQNAMHKVIQGKQSIDARLSIIDMLVEINRDLLGELDDKNHAPIMEYNVHLGVLQRLVAHGVDINFYSKDFGTVLHNTMAFDESYAEFIRWAFSNGFNLVNHTDEYGMTPLIFAVCKFGTVSDEALELFRQAGANFNAEDDSGSTVLFNAIVISKNVDFIRRLVEYGADVGYKNYKKQNVLHRVVQIAETDTDDDDNNDIEEIEERLPIIDLLVELNGGLLEDKDVNNYTPLLQPNVPLRLLKRLVRNGADINTYDSSHGTILHLSDDEDTYTNLVKWSLSNGFRLINRTDRKRRTPLMYAIEKYKTVEDETLRLFHKAGADFNAEDDDGDSVLFYVLYFSESVDFIWKILQHGVNVNHINRKNDSAEDKIRQGCLDSEQKLCALKMLGSKGFRRTKDVGSLDL